MSRGGSNTVLCMGAILVLAALAGWLATGREGYTRWPDAKLAAADAEAPSGQDELLADVGFDDPRTPSAVPAIESRFALGLVPGGFDPKHLLSVATLVVAGLGLLTLGVATRRRVLPVP